MGFSGAGRKLPCYLSVLGMERQGDGKCRAPPPALQQTTPSIDSNPMDYELPSMASLADIPAHLLTADAKPQFIEWLVRIPTTYGIRRRLLSLWAQATGAALQTADHEIIKRTPEA